MDRDTLRQLVSAVTFVFTVTVNALANILPLNGLETGQISDSFRNLFAPAGYVFAIWGVIYLLLAAFTVYQALPAQRENPALRRLGYWFAASNVLNGLWIFAWHYQQFVLSIILMLGLLGSLIASYVRLEIGRKTYSALESWTIRAPFSTYLGWISVATIANAAVVLIELGWNGFGIAPATWTVVMLGIAMLLGAFVTITRRELAYSLVLIWAFAGIFQKQMGITPLVATVAAIAAGVVLAALIVRFVRLTAPRGPAPAGA